MERLDAQNHISSNTKEDLIFYILAWSCVSAEGVVDPNSLAVKSDPEPKLRYSTRHSDFETYCVYYPRVLKYPRACNPEPARTSNYSL